MSRKDYTKLAQALFAVKVGLVHDYKPQDTFDATVHIIASVLDADNPKFGRERFIKACVGSSGETG